MSKLSGDNASENLSLLLDGELMHSQEVPLFTELASNDELRAEMREMVAIKNTVRNDSEAFVPPFVATAAVFQAAGYSVPGALAVGFKTLLVKYFWVPILAAGIAGLTTFGILDFNHSNDLRNAAENENLLREQLQNSNSEIAVLMSENERLQIAASRIPETKEVIRYVNLPIISAKSSDDNFVSKSLDENKTLNNNSETQILTASSQAVNDYDASRLSLYDNSNHPTNNNGRIESSYSPMRNSIKLEGSEYMLTFRGMAGMVYPQVNTNTTAEMSNFALGMFFKTPYQGVRIGVEFGHEPFSQQFNNTENGMTYSYEQLPNIWWGGAGVIADFNTQIDELFGARPYGKLFLGASEIGPLGKVGVGFQWFSTSWGLGASLGLEGSLLGYQNQGTWYTSEKFGVTYGLSIQF